MWKIVNTPNLRKHNIRFASFSDLSVTTAPCMSEIQEYLSHPVENIKDLLKWWVDNKTVYPRLHQVSQVYIAIVITLIITLIRCPATSTSIERVFSQGCHILPFTCNRLSSSSIWVYLCFGSWACSGLVVLSDVVAAVSAIGKNIQ